MELMIHSIYSNREIFLRELISNASDAMDKHYYLAMTEGRPLDRKDLEVRIRINKEKRLLRISDRGIGMNEDELIRNLGTIAKSGSLEFKEQLNKDSEGSIKDLIGQFGVGFYSAFMVADRIVVLTKRYDEENGWRFESGGVDGYTVRPYEKKVTGTEVILHIREDEEGSDDYGQYLREYPIYKLIKKYSDYVRYPIKLYMPHPEIAEGSIPENPVYREAFEYETVNSMVPVWQKTRSEVTREEQNAFFKEHFSEKTDPMSVLFSDVEGSISFKSLLYIPGKQPHDYGSEEYKPGLELYASGVKIMDHCTELLSEEYNFVRGVVDTTDISLNISREMLQKNRTLTVIEKNLAKKVRNELLRMLRDDRDEYLKFHENFGHHLKVIAMDDYGKKKDELGELLLFYSAKEKKMITLPEYVEAMPEEQAYIYYASGSGPDAIERIPQTEIVREHGMDILYFTDKADQFVAQMFGSFKNKRFRSVASGDLGLPEEKAAQEKAQEEYRALFDFVKQTLGDRVDDVISSTRLRSHPVCLSNGEGITFEMERYFRSISPDMPMKAKCILELNTAHAAVQALDKARTEDPERAVKYTEILFTQARMIAGMPVDDPSGYTDLLCSLF